MFLRLLALLLLVAATAPAQTPERTYEISVDPDAPTVPVCVSASDPALDALARAAFGAHGRYRLAASGFAFDVKFSALADNQVRVDITRASGAPVGAQIFRGSTARQALLRAADYAVEQTNGIGLKGWFASRLAFIGERTGATEVYVGDLFFGELKQLTNDRKQSLTPRFSPEGSKILYTSYLRGFPDIYAINLGSFQRSDIARFQGTNSGGRFSPDGSRIAMILSGRGNPDLYLADERGRNVQRRTNTPSAVEASPCWSPDGRQIVLTSDVSGGAQLYVMPSEGGSLSRLPTNISGYCAEPDWSRGAPSKIAFTARMGKGYQIAVFDLTTRQPAKVVSSEPVDAVEPVWLADGRHLIYTARSANKRSLVILDTASGRKVPLSPASFGSASQASVVAP